MRLIEYFLRQKGSNDGQTIVGWFIDPVDDILTKVKDYLHVVHLTLPNGHVIISRSMGNRFLIQTASPELARKMLQVALAEQVVSEEPAVMVRAGRFDPEQEGVVR